MRHKIICVPLPAEPLQVCLIFFCRGSGRECAWAVDGQTGRYCVMKFASMTGWKPAAGKESNVASAIGYLERKFKVNYDQRYTADVDSVFAMSTKNHHIKSLAHSPDVVGLFFPF